MRDAAEDHLDLLRSRIGLGELVRNVIAQRRIGRLRNFRAKSASPNVRIAASVMRRSREIASASLTFSGSPFASRRLKVRSG